MAKTYAIGVKDIKAGAIGAGGTMGTTLTSVGKIYKDTASLVEAAPTVTRHYSEGSKYPFLATLVAGETPLKFTIVDTSAEELAKWLGGTVDTDKWLAGLDQFSQELSIEVEGAMGINIQIARALVYGIINWNMSRTEIAKVEITAEVLEPEDAATPPVKTLPAS
jgi:hypothetical protein